MRRRSRQRRPDVRAANERPRPVSFSVAAGRSGASRRKSEVGVIERKLCSNSKGEFDVASTTFDGRTGPAVVTGTRILPGVASLVCPTELLVTDEERLLVE